MNEIAQRTVASVNRLVQSRSLAIVQAAVAEAVGSVVGEYRPSVSRPAAGAGASAPAAAVAAAHAALLALHPPAASSLDAALAASLATIADGPGKVEGVRVGKAAATAVLEAIDSRRQRDRRELGRRVGRTCAGRRSGRWTARRSAVGEKSRDVVCSMRPRSRREAERLSSRSAHPSDRRPPQSADQRCRG